MDVTARARRKATRLSVAPSADCPSVVSFLNVAPREFDKWKITECRYEKILYDFSVAFVRFRRDLFTDGRMLRCEPLSNRHTARIDMFASIKASQ